MTFTATAAATSSNHQPPTASNQLLVNATNADSDRTGGEQVIPRHT
jgi:hypothetical protein